jgi:hypothetical protein
MSSKNLSNAILYFDNPVLYQNIEDNCENDGLIFEDVQSGHVYIIYICPTPPPPAGLRKWCCQTFYIAVLQVVKTHMGWISIDQAICIKFFYYSLQLSQSKKIYMLQESRKNNLKKGPASFLPPKSPSLLFLATF